jgi:hypothetical protein
LALEFHIPYIRTQYEKPYLVPELNKIINIKFFVNLLKIFILNVFTLKNRKTLKKSQINTNDLIIGVGYTGMMNSTTVFYGLKALRNVKKDLVVEAVIHPNTDIHTEELLLAQDKKLSDNIMELGFIRRGT